MKNSLGVIVTVMVCLLSILLFLSGMSLGSSLKQKDIENRAKKIEKECYTETDIELIIFGEKQL